MNETRSVFFYPLLARVVQYHLGEWESSIVFHPIKFLEHSIVVYLPAMGYYDYFEE
jgi:hypothetical protein